MGQSLQGPLISLIEDVDLNINKPVVMISDYELDKGQDIGIGTSCHNCCFTILEGKNQRGCEFNRLEKFAKTTNLIRVSHFYMRAGDVAEEYMGQLSLADSNKYVLVTYHDDDLISIDSKVDAPDENWVCSYFVIDGRICNYFKNKHSDWAKIYQGGVDRVHRVEKEAALRISVVIYIDGDTTEQDFLKTLMSVKAQLLSPIQVLVLNNKSKLNITGHLDQLALDIGCTWRNSKTLWNDMNKPNMFDENMQYIEGTYFVLVDGGTELSTDLTYELNESLNHDLDRWICLTSSDMLIAQTKVTKFLDGFQEVRPVDHDQFISGLEEKIKYFADKSDKGHMVKKLADLFEGTP